MNRQFKEGILNCMSGVYILLTEMSHEDKIIIKYFRLTLCHSVTETFVEHNEPAMRAEQ